MFRTMVVGALDLLVSYMSKKLDETDVSLRHCINAPLG